MNIRNLILALTFFGVTAVAQSQSIQLHGTIFETINGEKLPLPFANIIQSGTTNGASSDFDGKFSIRLETGAHKLLVSCVGYMAQEVNITVSENMPPITITITMKTNAEIMEGIEVVGFKDLGNEKMLLAERKDGEGLTNLIGQEEMARTGASNVAAGLSKMAGVSVVGTRNVFVRGLGDRYNAAYLNGMPIASPDPDKRVIPLDIFPTAVVRNIAVDKAYLPSLYGDFSGGAINIQTRKFFQEPTLRVSVGAGANTNAFGQDFLTYQGGRKDYWGVDDGTRAMPTAIANSDLYNSTEGLAANQKFNYRLNPSTLSTPINSNFKIYGGDYYKIGADEKKGLGYLVLASHNNSASFSDGNYQLVNKQNDIKLDYDIRKFNRSTKSSALSNVFLDLSNNQSINYTFMLANMSSDEVQETDGKHFDYANNIYSRRYTYRQNTLFAHQLSGEHKANVGNGIAIDWAASTNIASSQEPDRRQFVYLYGEGAGQNEYTFNAIDRLDNHRFFSQLDETEYSGTASARYVIDYQVAAEDEEAEEKLSVEAGYQLRSKKRHFDYRQFIYDLNDMSNKFPTGMDASQPESYLTDALHEEGGFYVLEVANPASAHDVHLKTSAYYANAQFTPNTRMEASLGARYEDAYQSILFRDQQQPTLLRKEAIASTNLLPSLALKYTPTEESAVRFTASKTISRPGFKEVAPFEWTEVFGGIKMIGNPELRNGTNYNTDLRYEVYPNYGELIAATAFFKYLDNPIERANLATASGRLQSFNNADKATVAGLELEMVKSMGFLAAHDSAFWTKLSIGSNFSYIHSEVTLNPADEGATTIETNNARPLQGASPWLANVNATYSDYLTPTQKLSVTLSYNIFGRRLFAAGIQGIGDMYELPAGKLNLVASMDVAEKLQVGISASNLLNPAYTTIQEATEGPAIEVNNYKRGMSIGASLVFKIR